MSEHSPARLKLQSLVERAERLLETDREFFTDGTLLALSDSLTEAKQALAGKRCLPFNRSREFLTPREEEEILFATARFTMAPSYAYLGETDHLYGLEPALGWFEQQNMRFKSAEWLNAKAKFVLEQAEDLLNSAVYNNAVGSYDVACGDQLRLAMDCVKQTSSHASMQINEDLARSLVTCMNRIRDFRFSRILRTDTDHFCNLYTTKEGWHKLKESVLKDQIVAEQYKRIREIADSHSLEYIENAALLMQENIDYSVINQEFYVWSFTDKLINFTAPEHAVSASLAFILPAEENEQHGLGHVWIDNVEMQSASGGSIQILNNGFDKGESGSPYHWKAAALHGEPVFRWEEEYPFCGGGDRAKASRSDSSSRAAAQAQNVQKQHSLYLCNPTDQDEGAWVYSNDINIKSGESYTISFAAKLDGKFKKGLKTVVTFKDDSGTELSRFEHAFNRKSSLPNPSFQLTMQCDAIQYAFTNDVDYAIKTKKEMLYNLHDFCQGAEHWLVTNERPQK